METKPKEYSMLDKVIRFCLENKLIVVLCLVSIGFWGVMVAPFDWKVGSLPRDPVPVDAIPDIGENQQIVFTPWMGRSPQDIEDQITYPLTVSLLGIPGVRTVRSFSFFGFSSIYIIFKDDVDFYWSRTRVLEKLNSLPPDTLPEGVKPALGPDATSLGQVFWYTLEGRDAEGNPTGGWDLHELRTTQDWYVRYAFQGVEGVSEVASIGGFVQEYQIDVDPDAMRAYGVTLGEIYNAVRMSNVDVGARTIEINEVEYIVRGLGFIETVEDIENTVIKSRENVPVLIRNIATVSLGPALRRGALDKGGAAAVGGVVVARYGENPLATINRIKDKIAEISPGLPRKTLEDGTVSQVVIVPFYDRSGLIYETLGTLRTALTEQILVTIIVVLVMVMHFRSSFLISSLLPISVLMCFIAMKTFGVDANIVALSGIAIAIGTMVDMGIVISENILRHLDEAHPDEDRLEVIFRAASEVGSAITTAVLTTIVSFLPVFTMEAAEGKLFKPLAFTKTFALLAAITVALTIIPPAAHILLSGKKPSRLLQIGFYTLIVIAGAITGYMVSWMIGSVLIMLGLYRLAEDKLPEKLNKFATVITSIIVAFVVAVFLSNSWVPLGPEKGVLNIVFVVMLIGGVLGLIIVFQQIYTPMLRWCLQNKILSMILPFLLVLIGGLAWLGTDRILGFVPKTLAKVGLEQEIIEESVLWTKLSTAFPGLGKEFMPPLDEGSYLFMPTTMAHAPIGKAVEFLEKQDMAIRAIPEVQSVVGKIGRAETPLDSAPISMVETVINYKPEYILNKSGGRKKYKYDTLKNDYARDEIGSLIEDDNGRPFRQWRSHIKRPDDIWDEIVRVTAMPGMTSAPKLQPIAARIVMLQSGMRAPMGVKIFGPDLETIESVGMQIEKFLKQVPEVNALTVIADRVVGKPYLEIDIDREAIARYGMNIRQVQDVIEVAVGGRKITTTVEGRERYPVRVRYLRELRDDIESLERILVPAPDGTQIPLGQVSRIYYRPGPQAIKSEDTFLVAYVIFDKQKDLSEVEVVEAAQAYLIEKQESGEFVLPSGVSYRFTGNYENQIRSEKRLAVVLPLALLIIFVILYLQFKSTSTTMLIFSGIIVAWAGGFLMLWLYGQPWFMDVTIFDVNMRDLFQIRPINLSVAVWVGFLALFGIASDNGVILGTYLKQTFEKQKPKTIQAVREATIEAAQRRIRPCLMTSATTILALIPVLTSTGRGSDVMVPMAIPSFGGMTVVLISVFVVPTLFSAIEEFKVGRLPKID